MSCFISPTSTTSRTRISFSRGRDRYLSYENASRFDTVRLNRKRIRSHPDGYFIFETCSSS